jgi:tRNA dimethylallyltransferase
MPCPADFTDALVLTGPTGSGKSSLALQLAEQHRLEIVSMDSMTLYRGLDIGTAKPTKAEQYRVRHHLIDVLNPWESGHVAWWLEQADLACRSIRERGKRPLFVGGTPFYLKALRYGLFEAAPADPAIRTRLEAEATAIGPAALHERLAKLDVKTANRLHVNDLRRVIRALEVYEATGQPISTLQTTWNNFTEPEQRDSAAVRIPCVVLEWPRDELYRRIETRIDTMLASGWIEEIRSLNKLDRPLGKEASNALGYRQIQQYLRTGGDWDEVVQEIKTKTRQFAKRQLTWFRHMTECVSILASGSQLLQRVTDAWGIQ